MPCLNHMFIEQLRLQIIAMLKIAMSYISERISFNFSVFLAALQQHITISKTYKVEFGK